jgi:hypothetical protein
MLGRNDGRQDIIALRERYDNDATIQTRVNEANKKTWDMLVYKNERAMSFDEFCKKFQKALQHFERANPAKHNGDVIDWIWNHIQNSELGQTVAALKASQGIHARTPNQILQEIAKESPNLSKGTSFQQCVSEKFMQDPTTPSKGTFLHQVPFPAMENCFAVLTRIGTGSATSSRNIVLEFWNSENLIHNISQMVAPAVEEERAVVAPTDATKQATNTRFRLWRNKMRNCK